MVHILEDVCCDVLSVGSGAQCGLSDLWLGFVADVLAKDSGECSICLEDLLQGETIARLACLCVYHKR